jgi:hypothetical protein
LSRLVLAHESRQATPWLICNVRQNFESAMLHRELKASERMKIEGPRMMIERCVKVARVAESRMVRDEKGSAGERLLCQERSARRVAGDLGVFLREDFRLSREERMSSEVSIAGLVGDSWTAAIWFEDFVTRKTPNQAPEPTSLAVTICADAQLAPSSAVAHL